VWYVKESSLLKALNATHGSKFAALSPVMLTIAILLKIACATQKNKQKNKQTNLVVCIKIKYAQTGHNATIHIIIPPGIDTTIIEILLVEQIT
jgi:hypothetical protein